MNGEDAMVTVLFVDIRDFTPFADRVTAREAVALLNEFFGIAVPVLEEHGGRVQQFLGDGMLGVFGAPDPLPDHADRGVAAARAIVAAVEAHFGDRCRVSVGVNSGLVIVGTIGGGTRFDLGIIGDPVNVAARVEQATRQTGDTVLVTEATRCLLERRRPRAPRLDRAQGQAGAGGRLCAGGGRVTRRLTWLLWLLAIGLIVPGAVTNALNDFPNAVVADVGFTALAVGAATMGALVATSLGPLPADRWIGWLSDWPSIPLVLRADRVPAVAVAQERPVSPRVARRLAWSSWAVAVLLTVATATFLLLAGDVKGQNAAFDAVLAVVLLTYPTVGAVIATRQPGNVIGWLFCAVGLPFALTSFCYAYATYALVTAPGSVPGGEIAAWLSAWVQFPPLFGAPALLFLLFPDGRLLGPRWRGVVWLTGIAMVGFAAAPALRPGPMPERGGQGHGGTRWGSTAPARSSTPSRPRRARARSWRSCWPPSRSSSASAARAASSGSRSSGSRSPPRCSLSPACSGSSSSPRTTSSSGW